MEINISPRMSGKTTRLINWVKDGEDRVVLFASRAETFHLQEQYPEIADRLYYWVDWRAKSEADRDYKEIGIDNVDCVLHEMLGRTIEKIEFNQELVESMKYKNHKIIK